MFYVTHHKKPFFKKGLNLLNIQRCIRESYAACDMRKVRILGISGI